MAPSEIPFQQLVELAELGANPNAMSYLYGAGGTHVEALELAKVGANLYSAYRLRAAGDTHEEALELAKTGLPSRLYSIEGTQSSL